MHIQMSHFLNKNNNPQSKAWFTKPFKIPGVGNSNKSIFWWLPLSNTWEEERKTQQATSMPSRWSSFVAGEAFPTNVIHSWGRCPANREEQQPELLPKSAGESRHDVKLLDYGEGRKVEMFGWTVRGTQKGSRGCKLISFHLNISGPLFIPNLSVLYSKNKTKATILWNIILKKPPQQAG